MSDSTNDQAKKSFSDTLNLPKTDFPIRAQHETIDKEILERWGKENIYSTTFEKYKGNKKFVLHDGPPYANGNVHLGSAYNKILKDLVCKSRRMARFHTPVTPGWDCHGLPIELKVSQENPGLSNYELKKACRKYANYWIEEQKKAFKLMGVLMNWNDPYITMSFGYEAGILKAFGYLFSQGFIERKNKTVPWCPTDMTVLAAAEIEYKDRKDPSVYLLFDVSETDSKRLFGLDKKASLVIWTTTPWTLPLNMAVIAHPAIEYVVAESNGQYLIFGKKIAEQLAAKLSLNIKILKTFKSGDLENLKVQHPFINKQVPILFDDSVSYDEGTAFVHCAPGCGPIDYEIGIKNNLEIYSPISADGKYTLDIEPKELAMMSVTDGQWWVIKKLETEGKLLFKTNITHSYPHCWRCRNGLIFRATPQWFFNLDHQDVKGRSLAALNKMAFIPENGINFLKATIGSRWEWCLSRQRVWGVPIPAFICRKCDKVILNNDIIQKVIAGVEKSGIEYWDTVTAENLLGQASCEGCGGTEFTKEQDILDVWFESGLSHYVVLYHSKELSYPADIYVEGIDQHRGWFQSSVLTSIAIEQTTCVKSIMTHGFTVDAKGQKMSKSLGNVVYPQDIIKKLGTDGLRLWVFSIAHGSDPIVSDALLQNISEVFRKIRNTCRFLLSNLYDFDIDANAIKTNSLLPIDYYALITLESLNARVIEHYKKFDFSAVFHDLGDYCASELSSFYLDICKDRLYVEKADSIYRRSCQTTLWYILDTLNRLIAPVLSLTAESISDYYQKNKKESIHLQSFIDPKKLHDFCFNEYPLWPSFDISEDIIDMNHYVDEHKQLTNLDKQWDALKKVRSAILKAIEIEREKGVIKHSLEAQVSLFFDKDLPNLNLIQRLFESIEAQDIKIESFIKDLLIVSKINIFNEKDDLYSTELQGLYVSVVKAEGTKCPRCWHWSITDNPDGLDARCERILGKV